MNSFMEIIKDEIKITEMLIHAYSQNIESNLNGMLTYKLRYDQLQYYLLTSVKKKGHTSRKQTFLDGVDNPQVNMYKKNRFYIESLKILERNLTALKKEERTYQDYSPEYIQKKLPNAYKDLPARCNIQIRNTKLSFCEYKKHTRVIRRSFPDWQTLH